MLAAIAKLLLAHVFGFIAAGYPAARLLGVRPIWCGTFVLSWLSLVLGTIVFQLLGLPLTAGSILIWQMAMMIGIGVLWLREPARSHAEEPVATPDLTTPQHLVLLSLVGLMGTVLAWRMALAPLAGFDTTIRWDFLARKMLEQANLDYYPPRSPADYRVYFLPDASAPVVAAPYWWIYAAWGKAEPALTTGFVLAQWIATLGFVYQLATNLGGRSAGWFATTLLAGSALFFRAVAIGQEAGVNALALAGALAMVTSKGEMNAKRSIAAALLCALGVMAREYGAVIALLAAMPLLWPQKRWKYLGFYIGTLIFLVAPWYLRNLMRLGHPFHSVPMPLLTPVSAVYAQILLACEVDNAPLRQPWTVWRATLIELLRSMPMLMVLGPIAALGFVRRHAWVLASLVLAVGLWWKAIAISHGGMLYTTRVLTPAAVLAAVALGVSLAWFGRRAWVAWPACVVIVGHGSWGVFLAASFPFNLPPEQYAAVPEAFMTSNHAPLLEHELYVFAHLPRRARVLSDNAYAHALLSTTHVEVVPIWSPEVAFVFDDSVSPREVRRELGEHGIRYVLYYPSSPNARVCLEYPFYDVDLPLWRTIAQVPGVFELRGMPE